MADTSTYDVVVVGAGNAALTAALAAKEAGANVAVLEKATEAERGGNTRFTGGLFRTTYNGLDDLASVIGDKDDPSKVSVDPYRRDDYLNDLRRTTGGRFDRELGEFFVDRSYETIQWMASKGVPWMFSPVPGAAVRAVDGKVKLPFGGALRSLHEGVGLSDNLFRIVGEAGIPVLYETMALHIITAEDGRVTGVQVRGPQLAPVIHCQSLILASGGFEASPDMRAAYLGPTWGTVKVRGTRFNTGEMIRAAMEIGAESYGEWTGCHATPVDADAPTYGDLRLTDKTNRLSYPFSVMVNLRGERFVDEGEDFSFYTYAKFGGEVLKQPNGIAFQVFDQKTVPLLEARYSTGTPIEGNSFEELAEQLTDRYGEMGFRKDTFLRTLNEFNDAVQLGTFNPDIRDGKHTSGLNPDKTNWSQRLDEPPFRIYPVTCGITFTFGGIRINTSAQVVDQLNRPIPGLFATGEITGGFFYHNYPAGAGLMRGAVFGRVSGTNAAQFAREQ